MKRLSLISLLLLQVNSFSQITSPKDVTFERFTPEEIIEWIDQGNDPNQILGEAPDSKYCVFWALTNRFGLYCDSTYTNAIFHLLANSKYTIDDALYFITDPCPVGLNILQYLRLMIENKHNYNESDLQYLSYFIHKKDTEYGPKNINQMDAYGNVFIVMAAELNHQKLFELAIKMKADPNQSDKNGNTALHYALKNGNTAMVKDLLKAETDVNKQNNTGETPLLIATENGNSDNIKLLLTHNAKISEANKDGNTPLLIAAEKGDWDNVRLFAQQGANLKTKNNAGKTAKDYADSKLAKKALKGK